MKFAFLVTSCATLVIGIAVGSLITAQLTGDRVSGSSELAFDASPVLGSKTQVDEKSVSAAIVDASMRACYAKDSQLNWAMPILKADGKPYLLSEFPSEFQHQFALDFDQSMKTLNQRMGDLNLRMHLAREQGLSPTLLTAPPLDALMQERIDISEEEVDAYFEENKSRFSDKKRADLDEDIRLYLASQKKARALFLAKTSIQNPPLSWVATLPCLPKRTLDDAAMPLNGAEAAAFEVRYFSRFFCADCRDVWSSLTDAQKRLPDGIALRHIPVASSGFAVELAKATVCAAEQSSEAHTEVTTHAFSLPSALSADDEKAALAWQELAGKFEKTDLEKLNACLAGESAARTVAGGAKLFAETGFARAPQLYINERPLVPMPDHGRLSEILQMLTGGSEGLNGSKQAAVSRD